MRDGSGVAGPKVRPSRSPNTEAFEMDAIHQCLHRQRYLRPINCIPQQCMSPQYLYAGATFLHPTTDVRRNESQQPFSVHTALRMLPIVWFSCARCSTPFLRP
jgi:hypothetical protein